MSDVTITITVSGEKGTISLGGGGVPAGAPLSSPDEPSYYESGSPGTLSSLLEDAPPELLAGGAHPAAEAEGKDTEGPPPMELSELGVSGDATDRAAAVGDDSPPEDIEAAVQGDDAEGEDEEAGPEDVGEPPEE